MDKQKQIPRWQQGLRPRSETYGDVWDSMSPRERRRAFIGDLVLGIGGAVLIYFGLGYFA